MEKIKTINVRLDSETHLALKSLMLPYGTWSNFFKTLAKNNRRKDVKLNLELLKDREDCS